MSLRTELASKFGTLARQLGAEEAIASEWTSRFTSRYTEPHRHYHTLDHIHSMLDCFEQSRHLVNNEAVIKLAIFFHDWVYEPTSKYNEIDSIKCFDDFTHELGISAYIATLVTGYIKCTITHTPSPEVRKLDSDLCLFLDFDLEVLSRPEVKYACYADKIRAEYGHIQAKEYCLGRIKVLRSFLARDRLYFSSVFEEREAQARVNLEKEIKNLYDALHALPSTSS